MTGELVREEGLDVKLSLVTSASRPLALFGPQAADAMAAMLAERGIEVYAGNAPARVSAPGRVLLEPDGYVLAADKLVALPRLTGPEIAGLPHTRDGFLPTDARGRVDGVDDVYAAGDCTNYRSSRAGSRRSRPTWWSKDSWPGSRAGPSRTPRFRCSAACC